MKPRTQNHELISALADGQLAGDEFSSVLAACESDEDALSSWSTYHLIGDVLRSPDLAQQAPDSAFLMGLRARLGQEPNLGVRGAVAGVAEGALAASPMIASVGREASNDTSFRWKLVAGFASIAAISAVAWNASYGFQSTPDAPQLALSAPSPQVLVMSGQGVMVRDARMQELLAEHKQFGTASALQMSSGFLRNATFEAAQGERR